MSKTRVDDESTYVGFDMESPRDKRLLRMRASQLGYQHMSEYVSDLVYEDLDEAEDLKAILKD